MRTLALFASLAPALAVAALRSQDAKPLNHLANETSPYLLQHQDNPVDWYPWGEEALSRAVAEDKPIFLSIGYSACHWCHVMEHESFESDEIAALLNAKFVNVKVDREERPDLDDVYMNAVVAMTGHGGWPMSVFLTPDLVPFFGGTYFPPEDGRGMPGFKRVIEHVDRVWREQRERVRAAAADMAKHLREQLEPKPLLGEPRLAHADRAAAMSAERYDSEWGGFASPPHFAPKFPHASELLLLLRHWARTGDAGSLGIVTKTLDRMAAGGMYDQLGGGFHRYSTDREWLVPHFEKMLYDNAQLARVYSEAFLATGNADYARVARETLDYLLREMRDAKDGFWSTQDADSEGEEGKFFVWSLAEVEAVLGAEASRLACLRWGVTASGNWEGANVRHAARAVADVAAAVQRPADEVAAALAAARAKLLARRGQRVRPGTDDKVLSAWNAMAIAAFASGYQWLGEPRYLEAAQAAARFGLSELRRDGRLQRSWRRGQAKLDAYLEDYAGLADALLTLFESDFDPRWLATAKELLGEMAARFRDPVDGGFFGAAVDHRTPVTRNKSVSEASTPAAQAVAALAFLRGGLLLGDPKLEEIGAGVLRAYHRVLEAQPIASPTLVLAVELHLSERREVVIAGAPDDPAARAFVAAVRRAVPPHHAVAVVHAGNRERLEQLSPLFAGKVRVQGRTAAYVCRRGTCDKPVLEPEQLQLR